jgi:flagellin-like protein
MYIISSHVIRLMVLQDQKALSPVISTIILIAVTVAVAIAATSWMGSIGFNFMKTEQIRITGCMWALDSSHANITVSNFGSDPVSINSIQLDGTTVADYAFVSGDSTVGAGETATIQVSDSFVGNARHQFSVVTNTGNRFVLVEQAPGSSSVTFKMEWGTVTVDDDFTQVDLQNSYFSPVVVCTPQYSSGVPRTVRVTDVTGSSFRVRVQNPSSAVCPATVVHYLVAEEGVWDSPIKLEARQYVTDTVGQNNNWDYDTRTFGQDYSGNILVFHQVMSYNDHSWITTYISEHDSRTNPPSSGDDGFRIALNGAEAADSHDAETISYIIIEEGYSELSAIKYDAKQTSDSVRGFGNSPPYNTAFSQSFDSAPSVLVSTQLEMDGGDGGWIVNYSTSQTQAGLMVDEDQKKDSDRSHAHETCGFLAFETAGTYH